MKSSYTSTSIVTLCILVLTISGYSQTSTVTFGTIRNLPTDPAFDKEKERPLKWYDVNTSPQTWSVKGNMLMSTGKPIGVMRSEKQYENFILHIEWQHMEAGGNSGLFVWSAARPGEERLPDGVEVQMLELDWVSLNKQQDGELPPIAYVHGELFGVGGVKTMTDNPRGERSKSVENRCKGKGEWNTYDLVAIDGVIKLSVNGKFVNGISQSTQKKGYICFEAEGAAINFRNLRIVELPPGVTTEAQTAPDIAH